MKDKIKITGARTHNLKNINVEIPRDKMVAITGVSGSGKSSLAFDTIFAEGQRRYVESLSSYARQFLDRMQRPDVDEITGLSPAISIDQSSRSSNPRSTVATITEIYDYLRILYARVGTPHCLDCGRPIEKLSPEEIQRLIHKQVATFLKENKNTKDLAVYIYAPVVRGRKGEYYQLLYNLLERGYSQVLVDGETKRLREQIVLKKNSTHDIDVLVDAISLKEFTKANKVESNGDEGKSHKDGDVVDRLAEAVERSLNEAEGLVRVWIGPGTTSSKDAGYGAGESGRNTIGDLMSSQFTCPYDGYSFPEVEPRLFSFNSPYGACPTCNGLGTTQFRGSKHCSDCEGARLREEALNVFLGTDDEKLNIAQFVAKTAENALEWFSDFSVEGSKQEIIDVVHREITDRLEFMINVGVEYLTLDRRANTLSGGEAQRIRLASQLGSKLVGSLYVLDEPTIGLHSRDTDRLISTLHNLRDLGNTVLVVEHDRMTIEASDHLLDLGPWAGVHGGEVQVNGPVKELLKSKQAAKDSLTVRYLQGEEETPYPDKRRAENKGYLRIKGGKRHNIDKLNAEIPLGRLIAVSGVSGSGKSSFVHDIVYKNLQRIYQDRTAAQNPANCSKFTGSEYLARAVMIDQSPIGRTSRSNPATYTSAFDYIRDLFAETKQAKVRGFTKSRFSFNTPGGRCEACKGKGEQKIEMHFLPTVHVPCEVCSGRRFTEDTLDIKYKAKNIFEVLSMTVEEAAEFFEDIPPIADRLETLVRVGLSYLDLGQPSTTLSGGEAQRIKIASELYRRHDKKSIYILDEPTVGLHYDDVRQLTKILQELVNMGNTVLVIEHNLDIIKNADYVIDMGPGGGEHGGQIVAKGTPEQLVKDKDSVTGKYLKDVL
ncbi:MAG: excinuclease ABC subunit UvrA [Candidatus Paceibacterota bacterium]